MIMPSTCPACNTTLIESYADENTNFQTRIKICYKHNITYTSFISNYDEVEFIDLNLSERVQAIWDIEDKVFLFNTFKPTYSKEFKLPWFLPNFKEYDKLIDKLKTYITFL